MTGKYLISYNLVYRVPTIKDVLELRDYLSKLPHGQLESFSYKEKFIKEKGTIVEEYQQVKAKIVVNEEKDPITSFDIIDDYLTPTEYCSDDENWEE